MKKPLEITTTKTIKTNKTKQKQTNKWTNKNKYV